MMENIRSPAEPGNYRSDITGLRAWAVTGVLLYHFEVPGIRGGFAGVDVFFVISGFLMAGIICSGIKNNTFNIFDFYISRARRIFPALAIVVTFVLGIGWYLLMPFEYKTLGSHARESLLFTSNLRYLAETGYFDGESFSKWLLHTWSLSVEWQFYLVYPIFLIAISKCFYHKYAMLFVHIFLITISLIFCIYLTYEDISRAFYLLPTRAWELMVGGTIFLLGPNIRLSVSNTPRLEIFGVAMIICSFLFINPSMSWPGALAAIPVIGAAAILIARNCNSLWTSNPFAQWLGECSYSVYLWHWPLVVLLHYYRLDREVVWVTGAIVGSLLMGWISMVVVEKPARRFLSSKSRWGAVGPLLIGCFTLVLGAQAVRAKGFPGRLPENVLQIENERHNKNPRQDECLSPAARCEFGGPNVSTIVLGDSHADSVVTAVEKSLPSKEYGLYFRGASACLFVSGAIRNGKKGEQCDELRETSLMELENLTSVKNVVVINRTTQYLQTDYGNNEPLVYFSEPMPSDSTLFREEFRRHYVETLCRIAKIKPTYVLQPIPEMTEHVPNIMGKSAMRGEYYDARITRKKYIERHHFIRTIQEEAASRCGIHLLDPVDYLCDQNYCYGSKAGLPLYVDGNHLSERGNRLLIPLFASVFQQGGGTASGADTPTAGVPTSSHTQH